MYEVVLVPSESTRLVAKKARRTGSSSRPSRSVSLGVVGRRQFRCTDWNNSLIFISSARQIRYSVSMLAEFLPSSIWLR